MPSDHEVSDSWVVVSWDPLTSVVDRNGNPQGAVAGFFVTYQVRITLDSIVYHILLLYTLYVQLIGTKSVAVEGDAINITNGTMTSVNITGLQQGSQYEVMVSPYIEGFQLGPPTTIAINTLQLGRINFLHYTLVYVCMFITDDINATMITTMTSAASVTITVTPTTGKQLYN